MSAMPPPNDTLSRSPVGCTLLEKDSQRFLRWCKKERVWFPSSQIAHLPLTGRGLVAAEAISKGDVVVEVPDDAVLMVDSCSIADRLEGAGLGSTAETPLLEVQALILAVMFERCIKKQSRWCAYFDFLPQTEEDLSHLPMFWTPSELLELSGTAALDKLLGEVQQPESAPTQVEAMFERVAVPFFERHPELPYPPGRPARLALWRWSTALVASYAFVLGDDSIQAMVPVWDLLNHVTGHANVRLHHSPKRGVLQMIATRAVCAGEELVNDFGDLSTSELLCSYGFVETTNCHDHAQVPLNVVLQACGHGSFTEPLETASTAQAAAPEPPAGAPRKRRKGAAPPATAAASLGRPGSGGAAGEQEQQGGREDGGASTTGRTLPATAVHADQGLLQRLQLCRDRSFLPEAGGVAARISATGEPPEGLLMALHLLLLPLETVQAYQAALAAWQLPRPPPALAPLAAGRLTEAVRAVADLMLARCAGAGGPCLGCCDDGGWSRAGRVLDQRLPEYVASGTGGL